MMICEVCHRSKRKSEFESLLPPVCKVCDEIGWELCDKADAEWEAKSRAEWEAAKKLREVKLCLSK